jgi:copper chaperone
MKTTFEIQNAGLSMDEKVIMERLYTLKNIWGVLVDTNNCSITFEYLNSTGRDMVKRELCHMGFTLINDTRTLDSNGNLH